MGRPIKFEAPELSSVFKGLPSSDEMLKLTNKIHEINLGLLAPNYEVLHNLKLVRLTIRHRGKPPEPCLIAVNAEVDMNVIGTQCWHFSSRKEFLYRTDKDNKQESMACAIVKYYDPSYCTYGMVAGFKRHYKGLFLYSLNNIVLAPLHVGLSYPSRHHRLDSQALKNCLAARNTARDLLCHDDTARNKNLPLSCL